MVGTVGRRTRIGGAVAAIFLFGLSLLAAEAGAATASSGKGGLSATPAAEPTVPPPGAVGRQVFPIRGPHEYWDGFGAGRGHEGADVGAACGTPLVAVAAGRITMSEYHARAGNYAVLDLKASSLDLGYMHLTRPALPRVGQAVAAGQVIGYVGDTGNASGCHLHFELWEGEYYEGGAAIDPMPFLESLDRKNAKRARR